MITQSELDGSGYDRLADEYYDPVKHPTCADFRHASYLALDKYLDQPPNTDGDILELGAGKSLVAEWLDRNKKNLSRLTIIDASPRMLTHSQTWLQRGVVAQAITLESARFPDGAFLQIVASLGDPYNTVCLWSQVRRWLRPEGIFIFTTPSFQWASRFRQLHQIGGTDVAEFMIGGEIIHVPSIILSEWDQTKLIQSCGLHPSSPWHISRRNFKRPPISRKITDVDTDGRLPIVTAYVACRTSGN